MKKANIRNTKPLWQVYKTLDKDWTFFACGMISDGYSTRTDALEAALTCVCNTFILNCKEKE